jgi:hypothetical protein
MSDLIGLDSVYDQFCRYFNGRKRFSHAAKTVWIVFMGVLTLISGKSLRNLSLTKPEGSIQSGGRPPEWNGPPHPMASICKHPRVRIVSRQEDVEYVECIECGEVFDSDEFRDMEIEEKASTATTSADED